MEVFHHTVVKMFHLAQCFSNFLGSRLTSRHFEDFAALESQKFTFEPYFSWKSGQGQSSRIL